jgi:hypothetical protein
MLQTMIGTNSPLERLRQRRGVFVRGSSDRGRQAAGLSAGDERLLQRILSQPVDFIDSKEFYQPDAEFRIYDEAPVI